MKKICQILAISSVSLLLSACYNSGAQIDQKNVNRMPAAVTKHVVNQSDSITTTAASTASVVSRVAGK